MTSEPFGISTPWAKPCLAFALLLGPNPGAPLSAADTPAAAAVRRQVTLEVISKWCPDVHFHECEPYFPSSAEELFAGAKVFQVKGGGDDHTIVTPPRALHSCDELGTLKENTWRIQFDMNNKAVMTGDISADRKTVTAPMYIYVSVPADGSFVDIRYCFLFGFNGAQCMRNLSGSHFNYILGTMAEHQGDWEGFTVRLSPDLKEFIYGMTEAHGTTHRHRKENLDWTGTHPQIRLGLDSHGVYNGHGLNDNDWITLADQSVNECVDILTKNGPVWRPWLMESAKKPFRVCGRLSDGGQSTELWAGFKGRMGSYKVNNPDNVRDVCGGSLSGSDAFVAKSQGLITGLVAFFKSDLCDSMPCGGPGGRGELGPELPALPVLAGMKKYYIYSRAGSDLVVSINKQDPAAQMVLAAQQPGDEAQQWYIYEPEPKEKPGHVCLVNVKTGTLAQVEHRNGSPVKLTYRCFVDEYSTWHFGSSDGDAFSLGNNRAISPDWDGGQNLNAFGNGPYKPGNVVGTWGWGKGQGNETWFVRDVSEPPLAGQKKYIIYSRAENGSLVLSKDKANRNGSVVLAAVAPGDDAQRWYVFAPNPKRPNHVCLVNAEDHRIIRVTGKNGSDTCLAPLTCFNEFSLFTLAGDRANNCAIRPLWDENGQNLNVLGNGPYRPGRKLGTWGWGGGDGNETWRVVEAGVGNQPK